MNNKEKYYADLEKHNKRGGISGLRVYRLWKGMIYRCTKKLANNKSYRENKISVCDRWFSFELFLEDMSIPSEDQQIDRINPLMGYDKSNCRWVSRYVNSSRQRKLRNGSGLPRGVTISKDKKKYIAMIQVHRKVYYIGRYTTIEYASEAYLEMYKEWHGELPPDIYQIEEVK